MRIFESPSVRQPSHGYVTYKTPHPHRILPYAYAWGLGEVLWGWAFSPVRAALFSPASILQPDAKPDVLQIDVKGLESLWPHVTTCS